ncbi:MAG: hypothetical protein HWD60_04360 [Defluviicoccus sp.]|nr:MAG: hypothetical protein HWD60_04360 [Defluviicoccus sp.]
MKRDESPACADVPVHREEDHNMIKCKHLLPVALASLAVIPRLSPKKKKTNSDGGSRVNFPAVSP